jgi:2-oxoglutarate dehydrogenase E2 component (dihydrolipoamide succinyltransferase)
MTLRGPSKQGDQKRVPMNNIRKKIAERLVYSQQSTATLTTFNEIDMTKVFEIRNKYKDKFKEKYGVNLGFMGFFVKATVEALKAWPAVNAFIEGQEIVYNNYYNVGVAVGTEKGLIVPVIRDADMMSIAQIEMAIRNYALKARDGKISIDDLSGGTFTISNGGTYGSLMSTPILNPPQSGILGMHKVEDRPVAINGKVEIRPMMYVALSYDHRIIDGKEAVSFLVKIKEGVEDPERLLIEI